MANLKELLEKGFNIQEISKGVAYMNHMEKEHNIEMTFEEALTAFRKMDKVEQVEFMNKVNDSDVL